MTDILFWGAVGYVLATLFPVPWLSLAINNAWAKVFAWFKGTTTPPAA